MDAYDLVSYLKKEGRAILIEHHDKLNIKSPGIEKIGMFATVDSKINDENTARKSQNLKALEEFTKTPDDTTKLTNLLDLLENEMSTGYETTDKKFEALVTKCKETQLTESAKSSPQTSPRSYSIKQ